MKKMLLVAIAGIAILTSCNKTYTCTCTSVKADGTVVDVVPHTVKGSKSGADNDCKAFDNVYDDTRTSCVITN